MNKFLIENKNYKIEDFLNFIKFKPQIILSNNSKQLIIKSREKLVSAVKKNKIIYGVNTGFGKLSQIKISDEKITKLQENLILSHASGIGEPVSDDIVRLIILTKIISLSKGYSGVRIEIIERLIDFLN